MKIETTHAAPPLPCPHIPPPPPKVSDSTKGITPWYRGFSPHSTHTHTVLYNDIGSDSCWGALCGLIYLSTVRRTAKTFATDSGIMQQIKLVKDNVLMQQIKLAKDNGLCSQGWEFAQLLIAHRSFAHLLISLKSNERL